MPVAGSRPEIAKREDVAHASGDDGFAIWGVRKDTATALAGSDGEYIPFITDSAGRMWVAIGSMPAAAATTDSIAASLRTDKISNNLTELTPKFFSETVAASDTDEELIALVASKKLRILALAVQCGATATTVTFESSTTTRKHKVPAGANGGQILPFNPTGWFETAAGESLTCTTGTGSDTEISGVYVEV